MSEKVHLSDTRGVVLRNVKEDSVGVITNVADALK